MKRKLKAIEAILILAIFMIDIYLLNLNINVRSYVSSEEIRKNPNNMVMAEQLNENINQELITESEEIVDPVVYDGLTLEELSEKLNRSLSSTMEGKGNLIASYSLEMNVDPYMAEAIILLETGCKWECSRLVKECNNVGGQKGSGCGSYSYFNSLDEGITAFIDNLAKNYIDKGLTTPEEMNSKYAASTTWAEKVNKYIESIKAQ